MWATYKSRYLKSQPIQTSSNPQRKIGESSVKLLLDEMYTGLKKYLQALGWDVMTVHDAELVGASDREIVEYARKCKLLLVTQDDKHADLASLRNVSCIFISKTMLTKMIDAELRKRKKNHCDVDLR